MLRRLTQFAVSDLMICEGERGLYVTAVGRRVIVIRVFVKKTEKTPLAEIRLASERAKEIQQ